MHREVSRIYLPLCVVEFGQYYKLEKTHLNVKMEYGDLISLYEKRLEIMFLSDNWLLYSMNVYLSIIRSAVLEENLA